MIKDRFTCIWIGGGVYPEGGWEYNLFNDIHGANVAFQSGVTLWQVPMDGYTRMQVGYAELQVKVMPYGKIGQYLFDKMQELGMKAEWICGECWGIVITRSECIMRSILGSYWKIFLLN